MIVEWVVGVVLDTVAWLLGTLPTFTLPDELQPAQIVGLVEPLARALGQVGPYINVTVLVVGSVAILAAFAIALLIKGIRIVASFASGGGGSAA